MTLKYN